jgi:hypothetical protein
MSGPAALVDAADAQLGRAPQGGGLGGVALRRRDGLVRRPAHQVVGLPADQPVADEAGRGAASGTAASRALEATAEWTSVRAR